jgi:hypothetical protein
MAGELDRGRVILLVSFWSCAGMSDSEIAAASLSEIQLQRLFVQLVGKLIAHAYENPRYTLRFGEAYRTPEQAALNAASGKGISHSLHTERLAIDLLLDIDYVWQTSTAAYAELGAYWKGLHPLCRWGGDFATRPDGNHFSIAWQGRA